MSSLFHKKQSKKMPQNTDKEQDAKKRLTDKLSAVDFRRSALLWWEGLFYAQRVKEVVTTLGCDSGIIGILTDADIELLYVNRSK